jgi:ubiquinone/menaquinone biosynthesis C-methylase UbiE/uncharacterized protein YbaR (Trm112 family)
MYEEDLGLLCCPESFEPLEIAEIATREVDGEIIEGLLSTKSSGRCYPIQNGIPRFVHDHTYNQTWDFKWSVIDGGKGLNYKIIDKADRAYLIHDLFDRNSHQGKAYEHVRQGVVLDIGCGVGQYSCRLATEFQPYKVVSMDLTGGVDVFRKIMLERFPQLKRTILMVQASVFAMPFRDQTFDYVFSLGVLMHTGDTLSAIRQATRVLKFGGEINLWVYAAMLVHNGQSESGCLPRRTCFNCLPRIVYQAKNQLQIRFFRRVPHWLSFAVIRAFSSNIWYKICTLPVVRVPAMFLFGTTLHPDPDYRLINNYDGWINAWSTNWGEHEIFPTLRDAHIVIKGLSDWRLGVWGVKLKGIYE